MPPRPSSSESHLDGLRHLLNPEYGALINAELTAASIGHASLGMPGWLIHSDIVADRFAAQQTRSASYRKLLLTTLVMRQAVVRERILSGKLNLTVVMGNGALAGCGGYAGIQTDVLNDVLNQFSPDKHSGWQLYMAPDEVITDVLARNDTSGRSPTGLAVATSPSDEAGENYGTYTEYSYTDPDQPHESWSSLPQDYHASAACIQAIIRQARPLADVLS